jgi:hypothetical protein
MPSRTVHLNSYIKNVKSTVVRGVRWAGGLSARTPQTVRQGPADRPREGRGLSAQSTRAHTVLSSFEVNNGPSTLDPWTLRPEANFLENLRQKPQILNKSQKAAEYTSQGPGLSAPHLKTNLSQDFQRNPLNKWNRHSSKCNACKFLIKVVLWKVKPMKLIPLDSAAIYPINPAIYHPLIALWPAKIKTLSFTFALSSFQHMPYKTSLCIPHELIISPD